MKNALRDLKHQLQIAANPKTKAWFEKYLRYAVRYRGVPTPKIKQILDRWHKEQGLDQLTSTLQLEQITPLWGAEYAEDKFAAALYFQHFLVRKLAVGALLDALEEVLDAKYLYDWSTTDWVCMRVLRPTLLKAEDEGVKQIPRRILAWCKEDYLWKARCSVVTFAVTHRLTHYHARVLKACDALIKREERFAKTAVGWFLREYSRYDAMAVRGKLQQYGDLATTEVRRNALKYL